MMAPPKLVARADAFLALVDASGPVLGIAVDPAWREAAAANLETIATAARLVLDFALPDELEPAPVFRA